MKTVAKILLINPSGKILVLKRSDTHPNFPLHYDFPGGVVDQGESHNDAVVRELLEETGITIAHKQTTKVMEVVNGSTLHLLYEAHIPVETPDITLSWEHVSYSWMSPHELLRIGKTEGMDTYYLDVIMHLENNEQS